MSWVLTMSVHDCLSPRLQAAARVMSFVLTISVHDCLPSSLGSSEGHELGPDDEGS